MKVSKVTTSSGLKTKKCSDCKALKGPDNFKKFAWRTHHAHLTICKACMKDRKQKGLPWKKKDMCSAARRKQKGTETPYVRLPRKCGSWEDASIAPPKKRPRQGPQLPAKTKLRLNSAGYACYECGTTFKKWSE